MCGCDRFFRKKEQELLDYYTKYSTVDGIITVNPCTELNTEINIPIVAIGNKKYDENIITINSNIYDAVYEAVKYFKDNNINEIGYIGEELTISKLTFFKNAMTENGIELNEDFIIVTEKRFEEGGYYAMEKLFSKGKVPRAIIAAYDNMALGAMRSIFEHGLRIPEDIAILGIDDNVESEYINPPLSSINIGTAEICKIAAKEIMNKITGNPVSCENTIPCKLNLRKSTEIL